MEQPKREKLLKADEVVSKNGSNKTLWIIILIVAGFYVGSKFNSLDEAWLYTLNTISKYVDEKPTENKTIVKENIENTNIQTSIKEEIQKNVATPSVKQEDVNESSCETITPSDNTTNYFANNYGIVIDAKNSSVVMESDTVKINYKIDYDYSFSVTLDYKDMDSETKEAAKVVLDFCYWIIKGEKRDKSLGKWYFHENRLAPEAKIGIINEEFEFKLPQNSADDGPFEDYDIYANDLECPQNWLIKRYEKKDDLITFNIDIVDDKSYKPNIYFVCKKINDKYKIVEFNNICSKDYNRIKIGSDVNVARIMFDSPIKENSTELYYSPTDRIWLKDRKIVGWYGFEEFRNYFENWQEVQSSNNPAGALNDYRDPEFAKSGVVNAKSGINLRKEPDTKSEKSGKFENGRKVLVLDKSGPSEIIENKKSNWFYITDGEQSGWCFGGFIEITVRDCYGFAGYYIGDKLDTSELERIPKSSNEYYSLNFIIDDFYIEPKFDKIIVYTDDDDYIGMVAVCKSFDSYEEAAAYYRRLINIVENHYELSQLKVSENKESSSSYFIVNSFSGDHRMISINNGGQVVSLLIISYKYNEKSKEEAKQKRLKAYGKKKIKQGVDRGIYSDIKMAKKKAVCIELVKDYDILEIIDDTKEFFIVKNLRTGCVGYVHPNNLEDAYTAIEIIRKNVFPNDNGMCTGLGGYYLGDICKTNLNQDQLHESSFWISVEQFTPVLSFTKGALLKITPKTNRIVGIKLLSQFGEYDRHLSYMSITGSYLGGYRRDPNTVNDTAEILERHYNVRKKPKGKDLWEIVFANNVILTLEKYGEYGQWSLYCYSPVFDNANEEWDSIINERQQKAKVNRQKQLESMGKTGLN